MSNRSIEDIVLSSFRLLGELRRGEIPDNGQINEAFDVMNNMISAFSMSSLFIPYEKIISFSLVGGSDKYIFTNVPQPIGPPPAPGDPIIVASNQIIDLNFVNLELTGTPGSAVYPVRVISKAEFYGTIRIKQLPSIPIYCFLNVQRLNSTVQFYPVPNIAYPVEIKAKIALDYVTRFTDITALPPFYFKFLIYSLARELRSYYPSSNWPATAENEYLEMKKLIQGSNEWNCAIKTDQTLNYNGTRGWVMSWTGNFV